MDREQLPQVSPRALDESEQRMLLRAVERCPSARDRAIITTMLYTGLRLSELTALVVTDVVLVAELAGHRRLDTTRRYSLPSESDRAEAVETVIVER